MALCLVWHELEANDELHVVAQREAALGERGVPVKAEVTAVDDGLELEADALVAGHVGLHVLQAAAGDDRLSDAADGELALELHGLAPIELDALRLKAD